MWSGRAVSMIRWITDWHMGEPGELAQLSSALTRHLVGGHANSLQLVEDDSAGFGGFKDKVRPAIDTNYLDHAKGSSRSKIRARYISADTLDNISSISWSGLVYRDIFIDTF